MLTIVISKIQLQSKIKSLMLQMVLVIKPIMEPMLLHS